MVNILFRLTPRQANQRCWNFSAETFLSPRRHSWSHTTILKGLHTQYYISHLLYKCFDISWSPWQRFVCLSNSIWGNGHRIDWFNNLRQSHRDILILSSINHHLPVHTVLAQTRQYPVCLTIWVISSHVSAIFTHIFYCLLKVVTAYSKLMYIGTTKFTAVLLWKYDFYTLLEI